MDFLYVKNPLPQLYKLTNFELELVRINKSRGAIGPKLVLGQLLLRPQRLSRLASGICQVG